MKKEEAKWYEKASGKKQHKAENSAKFAAKNELKKQRKKEKFLACFNLFYTKSICQQSFSMLRY